MVFHGDFSCKKIDSFDDCIITNLYTHYCYCENMDYFCLINIYVNFLAIHTTRNISKTLYSLSICSACEASTYGYLNIVIPSLRRSLALTKDILISLS